MELLIVISIVGIMLTVSLISMSQGRIEKELQVEANQLMAVIREAQNNALTGKKASDNVCGWGIYVSAAATDDYEMYYNTTTNCSSDTKNYDSGGVSNILGNYSLKNGVTFPASGGKKDIYFTIPHAIPYDDGGAITGNIQIQLTKGDRDYYVCVYEGGLIEAKKSESGC